MFRESYYSGLFLFVLMELNRLEEFEVVRASNMGVGDFKMSDLTGGVKTEKFDDLEAGFGGRLYPGIGADENTLRWGFIRKVYGILSVQILLTTLVAGSVVYFEGLKTFFQQTPGLVLFLAFVPLLSKLLYTLYLSFHQRDGLIYLVNSYCWVSTSLLCNPSCLNLLGAQLTLFLKIEIAGMVIRGTISTDVDD